MVLTVAACDAAASLLGSMSCLQLAHDAVNHSWTLVAGSAAQLAAIAAASDPEKENLAAGASAMVNAALRLQPLMARAKKLRTMDKPAATGNNGEHSF